MTMIKEVLFVPKYVAEKLHPNPKDALISIVEPNEEKTLSKNWIHLLELEFHDTDAHANNGNHWSLLEVESNKYVSFNRLHAKAVIDFLQFLPSHVERLFVHCHAGISRSAGVAKFIAEIYKLDFNHSYNLYNRRVYSTLIDEYFGHDYGMTIFS